MLAKKNIYVSTVCIQYLFRAPVAASCESCFNIGPQLVSTVSRVPLKPDPIWSCSEKSLLGCQAVTSWCIQFRLAKTK